MTTRLAQIAELVDGKLVGDGTLSIAGAATLTAAQPGDVSFLEDPENIRHLEDTSASALVVPHGFLPPGWNVIQVDEVQACFARIVTHFRPPRRTGRIGVSPAAHISPTAQLEDDVDIHPGAVVGDDVVIGRGATIHANVVLMDGCRLAENVTIFPGAVLYEDTIVGPRSIIHGGAVLGAYGFGYDSSSGRHQLSAQLGHVELGADVEVGAGTTIDRGTYGPTSIGEGTKIDNLVMIAHNVRIGRHNMLCSQSGIAGSSSTGDYVVMAGKVGVRDHVHIGAGAILGAMAGVMNDIPPGEVHYGIPATPEREQMLKQAALIKLPQMRKEFKALRKQLDELSRRLDGSPDATGAPQEGDPSSAAA
ncbi:MAG: UDP-3-O-(3-hydroxymyristoyl)glucosamine N-acyltransferase [Planctomycetota bacterium]|nr:MAG: UDP-3-O-(3-hydroxymyristoyl)glucosamine N-acyltransferase [Planctomycetota bacterium]